MTQPSTRSCPKCGSALVSGQRFCSNCGSLVEDGAHHSYNATERSSGEVNSVPVPEQGTRLEVPPPPPEGTYQPFTSYQSAQTPVSDYQAPMQPSPVYTPPVKDSSGSVLRQIGCGLGLVILLALALCGGVTYFAVNSFSGAVRDAANTRQKNTGSTTGGNTGYANGSATNITIPTSSVNAKVTYASVEMTIKQVTQGEKSGVLRILLKESNTSNRSSSYLFSDMLRLVLPDGKSIVPLDAKESIGPASSVTRDNWVDFQLDQEVKADQLVLHIGKTDEAQMDVPLKENPDVGKYDAKTVQVNKQVQYAEPKWTLTSATTQWSTYAKQADKGMRYVVVSFKVDNTSTKTFSAIPTDYMRLKTGDATAAPTIDYTLPLSINPGQTGVQGTCVFMVPEGNNNFTLIFMKTDNDPEASISFSI